MALSRTTLPSPANLLSTGALFDGKTRHYNRASVNGTPRVRLAAEIDMRRSPVRLPGGGGWRQWLGLF